MANKKNTIQKSEVKKDSLKNTSNTSNKTNVKGKTMSKKVSKAEQLKKGFESLNSKGMARTYKGKNFKWSTAMYSVTTSYGFEHTALVYYDMSDTYFCFAYEPTLLKTDNIDFLTKKTSVKSQYKADKIESRTKSALKAEIQSDLNKPNFNDCIINISHKYNKALQISESKIVTVPASKREIECFARILEHFEAIDKAIEDSKKIPA